MATAGGTPPTGATSKPKRELTPLQKFGLPAIGGLALIVGYMYFPRGGSSVPAAPVANVVANTSAASSATAGPTPPMGGTGAGHAPVLTALTSGSAPAAGAIPAAFVSRARTDPFEPVLLYSPDAPPPPPPPKPPPLPPRPKPTPTPVSLPPLSFGHGGSGEAGTPVTISDPGGQAAVEQPLGLPGPRISRTTDGAPRDALPLPRTTGGGGSGGDAGGAAPQQSYDKRLAGVIIGDGVRALLEITSGDQVTTQVVQPGDEVNGIRVLNIERFREGDRTVTRMLVRDTDGTQKYVDLKPSAQPATGAAGAGGGIAPPGG